MTELIEHPALDFSRYQPGDVITISKAQLIELGPQRLGMLEFLIRVACRKADLTATMETEPFGHGVKLTFRPDGEDEP